MTYIDDPIGHILKDQPHKFGSLCMCITCNLYQVIINSLPSDLSKHLDHRSYAYMIIVSRVYQVI